MPLEMNQHHQTLKNALKKNKITKTTLIEFPNAQAKLHASRMAKPITHCAKMIMNHVVNGKKVIRPMTWLMVAF